MLKLILLLFFQMRLVQLWHYAGKLEVLLRVEMGHWLTVLVRCLRNWFGVILQVSSWQENTLDMDHIELAE